MLIVIVHRWNFKSFEGIGISLAHIAAFMHEIEIRDGLSAGKSATDTRGIETVRTVALRLQAVQSRDDTAEDKLLK